MLIEKHKFANNNQNTLAEDAVDARLNEHIERLLYENEVDKVRNYAAQLLQEQKTQSKPTITYWLRKYVARGAAVILVICSVVLLLGISINLPTADIQTLAQNYYQQTTKLYCNSAVPNQQFVGSSTLQTEIAYDLYAQGKKEAALQLIKQEGLQTEADLLLAAVISYDNEAFNDAIAYLNTVIDDAQALRKGEAQWYKALSYLQTKQLLEAKVVLQSIVQQKSTHYKQAAEILAMLN